MGRTAVGVLLGLSVAAASAAPLFEPVTILSRASAGSDPALARLLSTPSTATVQEVRIDAAATAQPQLEFELLGQQVQAIRSRVEALPDGGSIWYGQIRAPSDRLQKATSNGQDDPGNSLIVVRSGNTLTGSIRKDGKLYRLRPLGDRHILVAVDETRMPADHPADYNQVPKIPMADQGSHRHLPGIVGHACDHPRAGGGHQCRRGRLWRQHAIAGAAGGGRIQPGVCQQQRRHHHAAGRV